MKPKLLCTIFILSITCSGCSTLSAPLNVMAPPSLTSQQREIKEEINNLLPLNCEIKRPFPSASLPIYNLVDLNGDMQDEVVVFYSEIQKNPTISLGVFQQINDNWANIANTNITMREGETLTFKDMTGDNVNDIILSYTNMENEVTHLIFQLVNNKLLDVVPTKEHTLFLNGGTIYE